MDILILHGHSNLPRDSRTLLRTPPKIQLTEMGTGQYWYYGIQTNLNQILSNLQKDTQVSLCFNIDGISPYRSSAQEFWPILFNVSGDIHTL